MSYQPPPTPANPKRLSGGKLALVIAGVVALCCIGLVMLSVLGSYLPPRSQ